MSLICVNNWLCTHSMLNLIDTQSGAQEIGRGNFPVVSLNQSSPAQIIAQVAGGHAVKAAHPLLESAIVSIDVLDMIDTGDDTLTGGQIDRAVGNPHFFGNSRQRLFSVSAQNDIGRQKRLEHRPDAGLVGLPQDEVGRVPGAIPADQYGGLFFRQPALAGFATPLAGCPIQALSSALLRLKEVGLIGFSNSRQADCLLAVGQTQEAVAPAECRVGMNPNGSGAFADARSFNQLLRVVHPFRFVPKSRQGRVSQGIEGRSASVAAIPLQTIGKPPARNVLVCAMRAQRFLDHAGFDQLVGRRCLRRRLQPIHQDLPLVRGQFLQRTRQFPEIIGLHLNTYPIDSDNFVIDQYQPIT